MSFKLYVVCKFTILASTLHSKYALQSGLDTSATGYQSLLCNMLLMVMCLGYFERQPNYGKQSFVTPRAKTEKLQACFGLMQPSRGLLLKLHVTLHDRDLSLLFFFFPTPKVGVLNGMMTSLLQSHPLYQRQLILLLVLNHLFSHQSTSLHLHLPGLSIRTGHIHPPIPDSLSLQQTWQAFLLRILRIQI